MNRFARITCYAFAGLLSLAASPLTHGADFDWPQFHGPTRDNISKEKGLLQEWPKGGPKLDWNIKGIGTGLSSVAVVNGVIYTAGDIDNECQIVALSAVDGKIVWKGKIGKAGGGAGYPGPRATPTVDGQMVYMIGQYGDLVAFDLSGKEIWRKNLNSDLKGKMMSGWGNSESILIDGENVICTPGGKDGTVAALNKLTGQVVWRSKDLTDSAAYMSPLIATFDGVKQYVVFTDSSVAGVGLDGSTLWRSSRKGDTAVIPSPVISGDMVYVSSGYGNGSDLFQVVGENGKFTSKSIYTKNKTMVNHHGGVILLDGNVYGYSDGKGWTCQDLKTGAAKWKEKDALDKGTISYADGHFYLRGEKSGDIVLIEATPEAFKEKGRFQQPDKSGKLCWPHLVISNGKLYVREQGTLLCYDIKAK